MSRTMTEGYEAELILTGGWVIPMDPARQVIENGAVAVRDGRVLAVGPAADIAARWRARQVIDTTGRKILDGDFTDLWIPTHVVHDAETDDMLSWLRLEHVHRQLGTELQVLVQLPDDPEFDCVADALERHERVKVFRDDHSTNQLALRDCFSWMYPELKKKK